MADINRQVLLKRRPNGMPVSADFSIVDAAVPEPGDRQVLLRGIYLSLDPYMRGRISGQRSYAKPTEIGDVAPEADWVAPPSLDVQVTV